MKVLRSSGKYILNINLLCTVFLMAHKKNEQVTSHPYHFFFFQISRISLDLWSSSSGMKSWLYQKFLFCFDEKRSSQEFLEPETKKVKPGTK